MGFLGGAILRPRLLKFAAKLRARASKQSDAAVAQALSILATMIEDEANE